MPAMPSPERASCRHKINARELGITIKVSGLKGLALRLRLARWVFALGGKVAVVPVEIDVDISAKPKSVKGADVYDPRTTSTA